MTQDEKDDLEIAIELNDENLFAVLVPYERVKYIQDKEFQQLRMDYLEARHALLKYIGYN